MHKLKNDWTRLDTDEKIRKIKESWQLGSSATQIAERIGDRMGEAISRNAIIGVYTRNAAQLADYPLRTAASAGNRTTGARRREQARKPRAPSVRAPASYHAKVKIAEPVEVEIPEPSPLRLPMAELDKNQCRWPVNDATIYERHLFCGTSTGVGEPYCPYHMNRSIGEGTKSEREAVKVRVDA